MQPNKGGLEVRARIHRVQAHLLAGTPEGDSLDLGPDDIVVVEGSPESIDALVAASVRHPGARWLITQPGLRWVLPPGSHSACDLSSAFSPRDVESTAATLTGLGPQHLRLPWSGCGDLAEKALQPLFGGHGAGPSLRSVAEGLGASPSAACRAVRHATTFTYEQVRRGRVKGLLLMAASRSEPHGITARRLGLPERTLRRWKQHWDVRRLSHGDLKAALWNLLSGHR